MFSFDSIIDTVQNGKKQFVETFVQDAKFKAELVKLVDAQSAFAKGQVKTTLSIAEAFYNNTNDAIKTASNKRSSVKTASVKEAQ
jgi:flagellar motor switch protein FliM